MINIYQDVKQQPKSNAFSFNAPDQWVRLKSSAPTLAKFQIAPNASLSISRFNGEIGSDLANVNRWRTQLKLPTITELSSDSISTKKMGELSLKVIRLANDVDKLVIYWITNDTTHYFNKITGTSPVDDALISAFIESQEWPKKFKKKYSEH